MQRGDLIIKRLALFIETPNAAGQHLVQHAFIDDPPSLFFDAEIDGDLQQIQGAAGIAIGDLRQFVNQWLFHVNIVLSQPGAFIFQRPFNHPDQIFALQGFEHIDPGAGEQGVVQFKGGVLRGRADEGNGAVFDERQKGVLLGFVEAMHFIDE